MNQAWQEAREEIDELGGNMMAITAKLEELKKDDPRWCSELLIGGDNISPLQSALMIWYYDVVLYDNTYNQNNINYTLDILCNHLSSAGQPPEIFASDHALTLISALQRALSMSMGVHTTGRVEVENWTSKVIGGPKMSLYQLFVALNERTDGQNVKEMRQAWQLSRKQLNKPIEGIFPGILKICHEILGPFTLNTIYKQMELSLYYQTKVLQLLHGVMSWNDYTSQIEKKTKGYKWEQDEDKCKQQEKKPGH
ncbi:hypothetical protein ARMSODRAFT_1049546 [Armillaria solidipes]|uniref:Uncharacterized protein n=1 Tax=Armillaria solidipes TaxID=1076256 RepID=A0A2H3BWU4_9AGAR|nr:hypothetical protein ARMSODRAFT_1049546 [Armillaria solidipes]